VSNIAKNIFGGDLARMARSGVAAPFDPRANNPAVQAEADFIAKNGMTRAEYRDRNSVWARQNFEVEAVRDLSGDPPELADTRGMTPARAKYANYFALQQRERKKLDELERRKADLEQMISAPTAAETEVRNGIKRTAAKLLGRTSDSGESDAGVLASKLAVAQHKAEAAKLALPELEREIDKAQLRVAKLYEKEPEFLNAAIVEIADASGLGALYLKKISELRAVAAMMFELSDVVGTYGSGFGFGRETMKFPRCGLPSVKGAAEGDYRIAPDGNAFVFHNLAHALRLDPRHNPHIPLPSK
jgi:hypothetical protein